MILLLKNYYSIDVLFLPFKFKRSLKKKMCIFTASKDFIHVRFLSIEETSQKASNRYKSTLAVTYLTEILEKAKILGQSENRVGTLLPMLLLALVESPSI